MGRLRFKWGETLNNGETCVAADFTDFSSGERANKSVLLKGQEDDSREGKAKIFKWLTVSSFNRASGHGKDSIVAMSYAVDLVHRAIMRVTWEYISVHFTKWTLRSSFGNRQEAFEDDFRGSRDKKVVGFAFDNGNRLANKGSNVTTF